MKMLQKANFSEVINVLEELKEDAAIPKNVKIKVDSIIKLLNDECEVPISVNKALHELDEIANDANMQSYARAQIWNIVSMLEKINAS